MSTTGLRLASVITLFLAWAPSPTLAQAVDQGFYYKLSTEFRGAGMKLDVLNEGPKNDMTQLQIAARSRCLRSVMEICREW